MQPIAEPGWTKELIRLGYNGSNHYWLIVRL